MLRHHHQKHILLTLTLLLAWSVAACGPNAPTFRGLVLDTPQPVPDFTLTDQYGRNFRLSDQRGRVVLLFFGYTHCPDVCPATLGTWNRVYDELGQDAAEVRFVFVTVDPERDTPQRLQEHLSHFRDGLIGLTGPPEELEALYASFGVFYEKDTTSETAAGYLVSHTASIFVVDQQGEWRMRYTFGTPVEDIVHDVKALLK
jgi:protein SCO1/2